MIEAWDSRGFIRRMTYDELRRPTGLYVTEAGDVLWLHGIGDSDDSRSCGF